MDKICFECLNDDCIQLILNYVPIKHLITLQSVSTWFNDLIETKCQSQKTLIVSRSEFKKEWLIKYAICDEPSHRPSSAVAINIKKMDELPKILKKFANLKALYLFMEGISITNHWLNYKCRRDNLRYNRSSQFAESCPSLEHLHIDGYVANDFIFTLAKSLNIKHLVLKDIAGYGRWPSSHSKRHLSQLSLNLKMLYTTNRLDVNLLQDWPQLEDIRCYHGDDLIDLIELKGEQFKRIMALGYHHASSKIIMSDKLKNLKHLHIPNKQRSYGDIVNYPCNRNLINLIELEIHASNPLLEIIMKNETKIEILKLYSIQRLKMNLLDQISLRCPRLTHLHITFNFKSFQIPESFRHLRCLKVLELIRYFHDSVEHINSIKNIVNSLKGTLEQVLITIKLSTERICLQQQDCLMEMVNSNPDINFKITLYNDIRNQYYKIPEELRENLQLKEEKIVENLINVMSESASSSDSSSEDEVLL